MGRRRPDVLRRRHRRPCHRDGRERGGVGRAGRRRAVADRRVHGRRRVGPRRPDDAGQRSRRDTSHRPSSGGTWARAGRRHRRGAGRARRRRSSSNRRPAAAPRLVENPIAVVGSGMLTIGGSGMIRLNDVDPEACSVDGERRVLQRDRACPQVERRCPDDHRRRNDQVDLCAEVERPTLQSDGRQGNTQLRDADHHVGNGEHREARIDLNRRHGHGRADDGHPGALVRDVAEAAEERDRGCRRPHLDRRQRDRQRSERDRRPAGSGRRRRGGAGASRQGHHQGQGDQQGCCSAPSACRVFAPERVSLRARPSESSSIPMSSPLLRGRAVANPVERSSPNDRRIVSRSSPRQTSTTQRDSGSR